MAEMKTVHGTPGKLAAQAYNATARQEFDYFESGSAARAHAEAEGFDPGYLVESGNYTKAPRLYSADLKKNMTRAFRWLAAPGSQPFLHSYHGTVTLGRTHAVGETKLELDVPSQGAPVLQLDRCDIITFTTSPPQKLSATSIQRSVPAGLSVGRNVISGDYLDEDMDQALRDRNRDWEHVLVVGDTAISDYVQLIMDEHEGQSNVGEGLSSVAISECIMTGAFLASGLILPAIQARLNALH